MFGTSAATEMMKYAAWKASHMFQGDFKTGEAIAAAVALRTHQHGTAGIGQALLVTDGGCCSFATVAQCPSGRAFARNGQTNEFWMAAGTH